jgi:uncharacterized protein (DUF2164 family)
VDQDLKVYLDSMEQRLTERISEKISESEQQFSQKIGESEQRLTERISQKIGESEQRLTERISQKISESEDRLTEQMRDFETRLLTEFWKWGRVSDQRIRRVEHSDATTAERLASMEERIFTLERKVAGSKQ